MRYLAWIKQNVPFLSDCWRTWVYWDEQRSYSNHFHAKMTVQVHFSWKVHGSVQLRWNLVNYGHFLKSDLHGCRARSYFCGESTWKPSNQCEWAFCCVAGKCEKNCLSFSGYCWKMIGSAIGQALALLDCHFCDQSSFIYLNCGWRWVNAAESGWESKILKRSNWKH